MMKIYEKIRKARQLKQIPLVEMAEKMGMSEDGYSLLERGKRRFDDDKIERAAVVLDMDLADLMGINESSTICVLNDNKLEYGVSLVGNHSNHTVYYGGTAELAAENERLKLIAAHQTELLERQERELSALRELVRLMKEGGGD